MANTITQIDYLDLKGALYLIEQINRIHKMNIETANNLAELQDLHIGELTQTKDLLIKTYLQAPDNAECVNCVYVSDTAGRYRVISNDALTHVLYMSVNGVSITPSTHIDMQANVEYIVKYQFNDVSIPAHAFEAINKLKSAALGDNMQNIGEHAFCKNDNLQLLVLGTKLTTVNVNTFLNCPNLARIYVYGMIESFIFDESESLNTDLYTNNDFFRLIYILANYNDMRLQDISGYGAFDKFLQMSNTTLSACLTPKN